MSIAIEMSKAVSINGNNETREHFRQVLGERFSRALIDGFWNQSRRLEEKGKKQLEQLIREELKRQGVLFNDKEYDELKKRLLDDESRLQNKSLIFQEIPHGMEDITVEGNERFIDKEDEPRIVAWSGYNRLVLQRIVEHLSKDFKQGKLNLFVITNDPFNSARVRQDLRERIFWVISGFQDDSFVVVSSMDRANSTPQRSIEVWLAKQLFMQLSKDTDESLIKPIRLQAPTGERYRRMLGVTEQETQADTWYEGLKGYDLERARQELAAASQLGIEERVLKYKFQDMRAYIGT